MVEATRGGCHHCGDGRENRQPAFAAGIPSASSSLHPLAGESAVLVLVFSGHWLWLLAFAAASLSGWWRWQTTSFSTASNQPVLVCSFIGTWLQLPLLHIILPPPPPLRRYIYFYSILCAVATSVYIYTYETPYRSDLVTSNRNLQNTMTRRWFIGRKKS